MISICIPIYNFNVEQLVKELSTQVKRLNVPSEIILIDDGSEQTFLDKNEEICSKEQYIKLEKNIGRSAIRNKFIEYATYDYLLFLDCDSLIISGNFIQNYIENLNKYSCQIICGGREYPKTVPNKNELLRWKYGIEKESQPVEERRKNPNKSFMTNNFLISRKLFKTIHFEEKLTKYGHEDTLFGYELKRRKIQIFQIDNPILNGDLESNEDSLLNTEKAISNLVFILNTVQNRNELIEDITLLKAYFKLIKFRRLIRISFVILKPMIRFLFSKGYVNLTLFDFYKLGVLTMEMNAKNE